MAYATVTDVESEFKSLTISGSSPVTTTEVTEFITQSENMINAAIATRYTTPVSGVDSPLSVSILKFISIQLVAHRIRLITKVKEVETKDVSQDSSANSLFKKANELLKKIVSGDVTLPDAEVSVTGGGATSYALEQSLEHKFQKGVDQW